MPSLLEMAGFGALIFPATTFFSRIESDETRSAITYSCLVSLLAFVITLILVPIIAPYFSRKGLKGKDMGRRGTPDEAKEIPSALGLVCAAIYIGAIIVAQVSFARDQMLADYNAALLSICFMVLLGFADDVLDLPWRYKLILPTVASLPLLANYHAHAGITTILVPKPLRALLAAQDGSGLTWIGGLLETVGIGSISIHEASGARIVDLGVLYLVYMGLLAVFATNSINIYAGVNGLEAGQALIIGVAIATANLFELAAGAIGEHAYHQILSLALGIPFLATTGGLLWFNVYPAQVFVGDTYCYFAGMTFAVMGILGHFSKTLLLFLVPQVFNFLYSIPQLVKIYPCPRHRLPQYDAVENVMRPSTFIIPAKTKEKEEEEEVGGNRGSVPGVEKGRGGSKSTHTTTTTPPKQQRGRASSAAAAAGVTTTASTTPTTTTNMMSPTTLDSSTIITKGGGVERDNMTLINLMLRVFGPMSERNLTNMLLLFQATCCAIGLFVRYYLSGFLFEEWDTGVGPSGGLEGHQEFLNGNGSVLGAESAGQA